MSLPCTDGGGSDKYSTLSRSELLTRISDLEAQLSTTQTRLSSLLLTAQNPPTSEPSSSSSSSSTPPPKRKRAPKPFDPSTSSTRFIALKLAYLGSHYNGFEHANNNVTPKPTVEEVLYKALRKTRLISPQLSEGSDVGVEVVWGEEERLKRYTVGTGAKTTTTTTTMTTTTETGGDIKNKKNKDGSLSHTNNNDDTNAQSHNNNDSKTLDDKVRLELNWDGCDYSKCGRTDRGVSAFGQVIALLVRSSRPLVNGRLEAGKDEDAPGQEEKGTAEDSGAPDHFDIGSLSAIEAAPAWDPIASELPYVSLLNSVLPPSIRILAWLPDPPPDFSARFSCRQRHYKYFFTNPAFCPTPGPMGLEFAPRVANASNRRRAPGSAPTPAPAPVREGWLDIERMRQGAKKLIGSHDFRNLCKIDPSNQMSSCVRAILHADIEEWPATGPGSPDAGALWTQNEHLNMHGHCRQPEAADQTQTGVDAAPKVYTFTVHGSAFLWHQVRCMMGVLFLVGQGLEEPSIIDELLDIDKNPRRPLYEMAEDKGLVLWDCNFGDEIDQKGWVYAGDEVGVSALTSKTDGKFGMGGVVNAVWKQWRAAKMDEVLTSSLLGLVLSQGDGTAFLRGGFRDPATASRSQKIFDGGDSARIQGRYVRVMDKPKMATLEEQNERYARTRRARRGSAASVHGEQAAS